MPNNQRLREIFLLALPIIGGMMSQNVLNLVDTAMVGRLGETALAAAGLGSFTSFMANALVLGLGVGVQAIASRRMGEGNDHMAALPLNGGLMIALMVGLPLTAVLWLLAPLFYPLLIDDPEVVAVGTEYFQLRLISIAAVGMNFSFRGYWNGVSMSWVYMRTLVMMHVLNVLLNYGFIFGNIGLPEMGAPGAALGTSVAIWVGAAFYFLQAMKLARGNGFMSGLPTRDTISTMLRLAIPNSLQQLFFSAGLTVMFVLIGMIGTNELAVANVLIQLTLVCILPGMGFGLAAATLVGRSLGRGDPSDASQWGWDVVKVAVCVLAILGLPMLLVPQLLLGVFLTDPAAVELGRIPLQILGAGIALDAVGLVLMHALLGSGDSRTVMLVSTGMQWLVTLPLIWLVGPTLGYGLIGVWLAQTVSRAAQAYIFAKRWQAGEWQNIKV